MKNRCFIIIVSFLLTSIASFSQVGINTTSPDASAVLDVVSTTQGFLPPRMLETERDEVTSPISSPVSGLTIYNTTTNTINYYNGTAWQAVGSTGSYVDLSTDQSISGVKTFNGNIVPVGRMMMPMAELNYFDNITGTTIALTNQTTNGGVTNMYAVNPITSLTGAYEFTSAGDGSLEYTGTTTKKFHIAVTISGTPSVGNNIYIFAVALDTGSGYALQTAGKVLGSATGTQFSSLHIMLELSTNDKIQLYMGNSTANNKGFIVKSLNMFAMGI